MGIEILGETYEEFSGDDEALWRGDLLLLDEACGDDCKAYMVCIRDDRDGFQLTNYVGYKAGAAMNMTIPRAASQPECMNIRLSWLRENWSDFIPIGSFETTRFLRWSAKAVD